MKAILSAALCALLVACGGGSIEDAASVAVTKSTTLTTSPAVLADAVVSCHGQCQIVASGTVTIECSEPFGGVAVAIGASVKTLSCSAGVITVHINDTRSGNPGGNLTSVVSAVTSGESKAVVRAVALSVDAEVLQ